MAKSKKKKIKTKQRKKRLRKKGGDVKPKEVSE